MRSPTWARSTSRSVVAWASSSPVLASRSDEACAASDTARTTSDVARALATRARSRVDDVPMVRINRRIADTGLEKGIVPLAALAALAAMNGFVAAVENGVHTRQRQLERHAERRASADDVGLRHAGIRGVDHEVVRQADRERARHRRPEFRRRVRKRVVPERADDDAIEPGCGA